MLLESDSVKSPLQMHELEVYVFPPGTMKYGRQIIKVKGKPFISSGKDNKTEASRLAANVTRILTTSDATPGECTMTVFDPKMSVFQDSDTIQRDIPLGVPLIGD